MRIDKVHIKSRFKNLDDFQINIDQTAWETVLLGLNATGKSNFLEALVIIFRDLDLRYSSGSAKSNKPKQPFDYYIKYECRGNDVEITLDKSKYQFVINGKTETTAVTNNIEHYLPKHVFIYYSGISDRLKYLYIPHQKKYYGEIIQPQAKRGQFDTIRRIFLAQNIHANFALIAFYMFKDQEEETVKFLKEELKIVDFGSALFVLKEPEWSQDKDDDFWGADGLVRRFLDDLLLFSFAPIRHQVRVEVSYKKTETQNRIYLYLKDRATFADLVELKYNNKIELFNALESIHISDMLHDVKIKVLKENIEGELAMSELSEGEKQLLTVLGLLKFTKDEESLILLDEPDTHLNPMWKWKFLDYLDKVVKRKENTQIIFCTHDPLVIGNMVKSQVQLFKVDPETRKTKIERPKADPRGLGVAGILISDMFDLPTTLDTETQDLINERNELLYLESEGKLTSEQNDRLEELYEILNKAGFSQIFKDPLYTEFIIAYQKYLNNKKSGQLKLQFADKGKSKAYDIVQRMMKSKDDLH